MWLERIDRQIAYIRKRQAEEEHGRAARPPAPDWVLELGRARGLPVAVHAGDCGMAGRRAQPVGQDDARRLLTTDGIPGCPICRPDTQLGIVGGLAARRDRSGPASNDRAIPPGVVPNRRLVTRLEQDPPDDHAAPAPATDHRTRPVRTDLSRRPGRPLLWMPAQHPQIRQRRQPAVPVVHGPRPGEMGQDRQVQQLSHLTEGSVRLSVHRARQRPWRGRRRSTGRVTSD
ncbi:DUF6233 domain-containing protein [Streptomyces sp. NPDC010273]|uniref:DUF6233 domain-containing protein n=1 Tax=Streptomyces sp. NPDC010273 TaxID=3364829 RepID=UPI0036EC4349